MKTLFAMLFITIATSAFALADLTMSMTAEPAHPVAGDLVIWKVSVTGGDRHQPTTYAWNADAKEFPGLYGWTNGYPFLYATAVSNAYQTAGDKTVTVTAYNGNDWVERSLTIHVSEARVTVTAPTAKTVWHVGNTYEIKWKTVGKSDTVQIGLWDFRYPTETGNAGETVIAFSVPNTGSFMYTVPPPSADGISAGNIGGANYQVSVCGWNDCISSFSPKFTVALPPIKR